MTDITGGPDADGTGAIDGGGNVSTQEHRSIQSSS
jgi:hypothetical protein